MRGRNNNSGNNNNNNSNGNRKAPNPLQRSYESNGPDVKVRGTAQHVAEKYLQLARDAQSSSDPVAAENYFQHAEHYYRILLAAQEQMAQQFGHSFPPNRGFGDNPDDGEEEGDDDAPEFQPGTGPQPDLRGQNNGANGNGYNGNGAPRAEGDQSDPQQNNGQRFDRPNRNNQDRNGPDRNNSDRQNNDRQNNDRTGNRRFDRNDRPDRGESRFQRQDNAPGGQGGYAPRPDAPRSDIPVPSEQPDVAPVRQQAEPRIERDRPERGPRPERAERRPRRDFDAEAEPAIDVAAALPSFLTTPVRVPVAVVEETPPAAAPAKPQEAAAPVSDEASAPKRPRRRRSPREVMDALGSDSDNVTE
ncbi:DUF4167 domain-containing protein [Bosea sp. PAMC 26642]|uniref:DUF4167 domain-containing protein n=1 Tax=Bosea sp. (strain PAMC 26642) TaxID=1792307 RepID=UPI00076FE9C1|nr:DUF4167 domain-containing protein [Bosea sp. PAMC 26642]AMJ63167.1 hypothetical protein AXW83_25240 [Bosea sp. PAMC 26642]